MTRSSCSMLDQLFCSLWNCFTNIIGVGDICNQTSSGQQASICHVHGQPTTKPIRDGIFAFKLSRISRFFSGYLTCTSSQVMWYFVIETLGEPTVILSFFRLFNQVAKIWTRSPFELIESKRSMSASFWENLVLTSWASFDKRMEMANKLHTKQTLTTYDLVSIIKPDDPWSILKTVLSYCSTRWLNVQFPLTSDRQWSFL